MLLAKYIRQEILATAAVVTLVLALILLGGRLMMYLGYAAEGRLLASLVFQLVLYRAPEFMQMILPLGFFIGILLTLGRMSVERELAVFESAGLSLVWVAKRLWVFVALLMALVMSLSLFLGPLGVAQTDITFKQQEQRADFETLAPGRFHPIRGGQGVTYVNQLGGDGRHMEDLFVAEVTPDNKVAVVLAATGKRQVFSEQGEEYLLLREGQRYDLTPGAPRAQVIEFEGYRSKIIDQAQVMQSIRIKGAPTLDLLSNPSPQAQAELHWRLGLPLLVPVVTLMALGMCRVNPRQGRFLRLFPAIMLYLLYLGLCMVAKSQVEKKGLEYLILYWGIHGFAFVCSFCLLLRSDGRLRFRPGRKSTDRKSREGGA